jgi:DNA-binding response OmpR family regulator
MRDLNSIVIAEDDKNISYSMKKILESSGYKVSVTGRISEIQNILKITNAEWLLLDIELTDGISDTLISRLKEQFSELYIIVITGYWERYKELEILNYGANVMLRKPYSPEAVIAQIRKLRDVVEKVKYKKVVILRRGAITINLETGQVNKPDTIISLPDNSKKLLVELASRQNPFGWEQLPSVELTRKIYECHEGMSSERFEAIQQSFRVLVYRTKKIIGDENFILMIRGSNNTCSYQLNPFVERLD